MRFINVAAIFLLIFVTLASAKKSGDVTELQIGGKGKLTDGTVFDSSFERGGQVIKGMKEEKEIGNEGLKKKILMEGGGNSTPRDGDEVEVHYTGKLTNGKKFDSSRDRGETFKFRLGKGEVIRGWDLGIATMKLGEKALFTIPAKLAYGSLGHPGVIPPNATLLFDVELLSWK